MTLCGRIYTEIAMSLQDLLLELDQILARLRYVKAGDLVLSSDHNDLVDSAKKTRDILYSMKSYVDENINNLQQQINELELKLTGLAKALVDPSGKYSPYTTIADALKALDDKGVQAALVYIVPPDDINAYPSVVENKNVTLANIKFLLIDGRGYNIKFDLLGKNWITTLQNEFTLILVNLNMDTINTAPQALVYGTQLTNGKLLVYNADLIRLFNTVTIGGVSYKAGTVPFFSTVSDALTVKARFYSSAQMPELYTGVASVPVVTTNCLGPLGFNPNWYTNIILELHDSVLEMVYYYDYSSDTLDFLSSDRGRITRAIISSSYFSPVVEEIFDLDMRSSVLVIPNLPLTQTGLPRTMKISHTRALSSMIWVKGFAHFEDTEIRSSWIKVENYLEVLDPRIKSTLIQLIGDIALQQVNFFDVDGVWIRQADPSIVPTTIIALPQDAIARLSSSRIESNIDLSYSDPTSKLLFLSNVVDRTKINDPYNIIVSNNANIDLSTLSTF